MTFRLLYVTLALVLAPAAALAQTCVAVPQGALVWHPGDDRGDDLVGFHHGVLSGVGYAPGQVGTAYTFDGVDDAVQTDTTIDEMRRVGDDFTLELWVRPRATRATVAESSTGMGATVGQRFAVFPASGGSDAAGVGLSIGTNGITVVEHGDGLFAPVLVLDAGLDRWAHVALVVQDRVPTLYVDGVSKRSGSAGSRDLTFASWRDLGTDADDPIHLGYGAFAGEIDEFTVYDRALAAGEVSLLAAADDGKCRPVCAISFPGANDDAWDVTRGSVTLADSGMRETMPGSGMPLSFAQDAFGALDTLDDPGVASFRADAGAQAIHFIDWLAAAPLRIERIQIQAAHAVTAGHPGAFDRLRLLGRAEGEPEYEVLYDSTLPVPFPILTPGNARLERCLALRPRLAREFRLELTQASDASDGLSGPQLFELNGYGTPQPGIFRDGFEPLPP